MTLDQSTKPKPFCFVVMPFDDSFRDTYELGIKPACEEAGAYCERVDEQKYHEPILDRIYNQISKADVIVADMSDRNPNVFYEVGYAHALGKRVILLTKRAEDIPFDLTRYWHLIYQGSITDLKSKLTDRVKWIIENPEEGAKETRVFDIRVNGILLSEYGITLIVPRKAHIPDQNKRPPSWGVQLTLTVKNISKRFLDEWECRLGLLRPPGVFLSSDDLRAVTFIRDDDKMNVAMFPAFDALFPGEIRTVEPSRLAIRIEEDVAAVTVYVRLFLRDGFIDYPITIESKSESDVTGSADPR